MVGGNVAVHPSWPHVLIAQLFQPSHNDGIPTVKGTKRDTLTQTKGIDLRSLPIHPQLLVSCAFANICLVHRWSCPSVS